MAESWKAVGRKTLRQKTLALIPYYSLNSNECDDTNSVAGILSKQHDKNPNSQVLIGGKSN